MTSEQGQLWEELDTQAMWVHLLRSAPLDAMGINGIAVYVMLKTYTNINTGVSFPSVKTLSKRLSCSADTVERALTKLFELGLLDKKKVGRRNHYSFIEHIPVLSKRDGLQVGVSKMRYLPLEFQSMLRDLKTYAKSGVHPGDGINVTFNVTLVNGDNNTVNSNIVSTVSPTRSDVADVLEKLRAFKD